MSRVLALWIACLTVVACAPETDGDALASVAPTILSMTVADLPGNVLGAVIEVRLSEADSVRISYARAGLAFDEASAAVIPVAGVANVPVLGLLPDQTYSLRADAFHGTLRGSGPDASFTTGSLPSDLPVYSASGSAPAPGFVIFAAGKYVLAIDNSGRVVWYHRFADGAGLNFMAQPNGHYVARPVLADPTSRDAWVEISPLGELVRTLRCARGLVPRLHDLILREDGSYWLMCDEVRVMDLTGWGGLADAQVTGTVVQHVSASGSLLFEWNPFDHFAITDLDSASRSGTAVNWTHGNAIDLDASGTLVVSFRSLNELTGIDTRTGDVIWRMGGSRNQFGFVNSPMPPFARQHGLRLHGSRSFTLLDNAGRPEASRAERYEFDPVSRVATLVQAYDPLMPVVATLGGTTQDLPGGHLLVSFGTAGRVEEYDAAANRVWQIDGNPGYIFRAQRIRSLYHPGAGER